MTLRILIIAIALTTGLSRPGLAEKVTVAVAANFLTTAENLAAAFEAETGHDVALVHGSSGKLYAQITSGAPFDVFLSADIDRPARLILDERVSGVARPYAFGRLILVLRDPQANSLEALLTDTSRRLAIADPAVAPYGVAAREVLQLFRGDTWAENAVFGESVAQAFTFFATGNTDLALVALAQVALSGIPLAAIDVPENLHAPIRQDAVLLSRAAANPAATAFFAFLDEALARSIIIESGYGVRE